MRCRIGMVLRTLVLLALLGLLVWLMHFGGLSSAPIRPAGMPIPGHHLSP